MKRVGDVLRRQLPPGPVAGVAASDSPECPICKGAGWLRIDVPVNHPYFGRPVMCECTLPRQEQRRIDDLLRLSALDPFRGKTFETFDAKVPGVDRAWTVAKRFARDPHGWLVLRGGYGCGKTHLAAAIANEAIKSHLQVLFTVVPDLLDHLRSTFAPTSDVQYDELFDSVRTANLLVVDDLGTESSSQWAREKLYQIFNYRYNFQLPTVVTTNRDLGDIDDRIRSRLSDKDLCEIVELKAEDYRERPRGGRRPPLR
ncbi:MAG: ATP-binding protein [Chloroflexi bacterium]|nr:ATP-binding protein [Chloroflexota bacterium]